LNNYTELSRTQSAFAEAWMSKGNALPSLYLMAVTGKEIAMTNPVELMRRRGRLFELEADSVQEEKSK